MISEPSRPCPYRRRVFYIPGYDPFPPRRYRELYRRESAAQAGISGYDVALVPRSGGEGYGWGVAGRFDGVETQAEIEVLVWSDLVRASMKQTIAATYGQLALTAWVYVSTGALWRLMRLRKGPVIAALYPVAVLLVQALLALGLAWMVFAALGGVVGRTMADVPVSLQLVFAVAAAAAGWWLLRWFRARDGRLFAYYLMHDFAYSASLRGRYPPALEARLAAFGDRIAAALDQDCDEVLVVGHSSGAHLAVSILADLVRAGRAAGKAPDLALLTLGQVVPMVSFLPAAHRLRADLALMAEQDRIAWIDVSAPGDGCSFALCDPVAVSGVAPLGQRWPLVVSAAFTKTLSPETWARLKRRYFRLHFQYLCAFDRPGDCDYFAITAGPVNLATRYQGRAASPSRIVRAASGFTSVRAT